MSEWFWKKLSYIAGWAATALFFGVVILTANFEIKDMDLWFHLASGRYILEHVHVPRVDVFSATIAGQPWVNHEWLFQVIVQFLFARGGADALIALRVFLILTIFIMLFLLGYRKGKHLLPLLGLILVLLVYQMRFFLRPDIFSLLFFVLFVFILSYHLDKKRSIWMLALIQVVWSNLHGYFILGPLIILIAFVSEWIKRRAKLPFAWNQTGRLTDLEFGRLKMILAAVALGCVINPYGLKGAFYPLDVFFSLSGELKIFFDHIAELQQPITWDTLWDLKKYLFYKILILFSAFSFWANRRKLDLGMCLLWLIYLVFSLMAVRNIGFFSVAAYLAVIANLQDLKVDDILPVTFRQNAKDIFSFLIKAFLIVWMVHHVESILLRGYYDFEKNERKSELGGISLRNFPFKAADFIVDNQVHGKFFNDFNSGAYLLGRAHPRVRVFIDGRTEVYGAELYKSYRKIWKGDQELFDDAVEKYGLTGAFLNSVYVPAPAKFIRNLYEDPAWVLVYFDYDAAIFLRDVGQNRDLIEKFQIDLDRWRPPEYDIRKLGVRRVTPYQHINRAWALLNMGFPAKAESQAREAVQIAPNYAEAYEVIGDVEIEMKEYGAAFETLRKASLLDPGNMKIRFQVARALFHLNEFGEAEAQCRRVLTRNPKNAKALFLLSRIYAKQQLYDESWKSAVQAYTISPKRVEDMLEVAGLYTDEGQPKLAEQSYRLVLEQDPDNEMVKRKLRELRSDER